MDRVSIMVVCAALVFGLACTVLIGWQLLTLAQIEAHGQELSREILALIHRTHPVP